MDKSLMKKWRGTDEYINEVKAFLSFVVSNSKIKEFIMCPCKKCRLRKTLWHEQVYQYGILEGYTDWIWHGEEINSDLHKDQIIEGSSSGPVNKAPILDKARMMHVMLNDVLGMHNVRVDDNGSQMGMKGEAMMEEDQEDTDDDCT
ncbi:hypothetical protein SLA2020_261810 [Shorea laevis]